MSAVSFVSLTPAGATMSIGQRMVRCRMVEKIAPRHGEKPYELLVAESFDGPVLRLSRKLQLLEEADLRHIRRGDALDLMETMQGQLERAHSVRRPGKAGLFLRRFALFAAAYAVLAIVACIIVSRL